MKTLKPIHFNMAVVFLMVSIIAFVIYGIRFLKRDDLMLPETMDVSLRWIGYGTWCCALFFLGKMFYGYKSIRYTILLICVTSLVYLSALVWSLSYDLNLTGQLVFSILPYISMYFCYIILGILILSNRDRQKTAFKMLRTFSWLLIVITLLNFTGTGLINTITVISNPDVYKFSGIIVFISTIPTLFLLRYFLQLKKHVNQPLNQEPEQQLNWPPSSTP